ncbi:MAG: virulence factor [Candidatus Promineifilaceae bacterium]
MTRYQIIYWRDIPVQVKVRDGGARLSRPLSPRFQKTVYRAAYRARAINGSEYIQEWRPSDWVELDKGAQEVMTTVSAELESDYSDERLDRLARNKGFEDDDD